MNNNQNDKEIKKQKSQNLKMAILAFLTALISEVLGIILFKDAALNKNGIFVAEILLAVLVILLIPINVILEKKNMEKLRKMNVAEFQSFMISHRENSRKKTEEQLSILKKLRTSTNVYVAFVLLIAFLMAFFAYQTNPDWISTPLSLFSFWIFYTTFSWMKNPYTKKYFKENESYVKKEDFPHLYKMAEKARDTVGCKGDLRIAIIADSNAGIARIDGIYSVQLGAFFLNTASEEEIFCVLLHEFAHIIWENKNCVKETKYYNRLSLNADRTTGGSILDALFSFPSTTYLTNYELFRYAASLTVESFADEAMSKYGNKETAASALIKLSYYEYYLWEDGTEDYEPPFANETIPENFVTLSCDKFKASIEENSEKWERLIDKEILSRSASHPTTKMRLEALGITKTKTVSLPSSAEFLLDAENSLKFSDSLYLKFSKEFFEERHKEHLETEEQIKKWENDGKPIIAEEYRNVVQNLRNLGRTTEAMEVCDKAIETLSSSGAAYAYYIKGNYLIHKYDAKGLEYIYKAMNNHNYVEEGLQMIGRFCCMMGMQKELDEYREKAVQLEQEKIDKYDKLSGLKKNDNLSEEKLPAEMLDSILKYISSVENKKIEKIYLIRKNVTEDFYASVFVIKFFDFQNEKDQQEAFDIMDKIFNHLDTCSDHLFWLYDFRDVSYVKFDEIPNSCVYTAEKE